MKHRPKQGHNGIETDKNKEVAGSILFPWSTFFCNMKNVCCVKSGVKNGLMSCPSMAETRRWLTNEFNCKQVRKYLEVVPVGAAHKRMLLCY